MGVHRPQKISLFQGRYGRGPATGADPLIETLRKVQKERYAWSAIALNPITLRHKKTPTSFNKVLVTFQFHRVPG